MRTRATTTALTGRQLDLLEVDDLVHDIGATTVVEPAEAEALERAIYGAAAELRARRPQPRPRRRTDSGIREYFTGDFLL